jgi:hypothetical protein
MLFGFILFAAIVAVILSPAVRQAIGWSIAIVYGLVILAVVALLVTGLFQIRRDKRIAERIAPSEVQLTDLQLTRGDKAPGEYRLSGRVHNLSQRYALSDVRLVLIVEDCVRGNCQQQAQGQAEVIRSVQPGESDDFSTPIVQLPTMAPPLGERRLSYRVWNTVGMPPQKE